MKNKLQNWIILFLTKIQCLVVENKIVVLDSLSESDNIDSEKY
jgi:hypothetical protein